MDMAKHCWSEEERTADSSSSLLVSQFCPHNHLFITYIFMEGKTHLKSKTNLSGNCLVLTMKINPRRLLQLARKWQRMATKSGGKRITNPDSEEMIKKGHFAVYTASTRDDDDQSSRRRRRRFVIPLEFLNHTIFRELLKLSEEQLGLPSDGPITLPCDASFLEHLISLFQRHRSIPDDMEKALLLSISVGRSSCCWHSCGSLEQQPFVIYGF